MKKADKLAEPVDATIVGAAEAAVQHSKLDELVSYLKNSSGYLLAVTTITNGNKLTHHLITEKFPEIDILKSIGAIEKLATERLKSL